MTVELSRPVAVSKIGRAGLTMRVRATAPECGAIAARMDIPAVQSFECLFTLSVEGPGVRILARGSLRAEVTRVCVVSAEEFQTQVEEEFEICFVPAGQEREDPDPDLIDEIPYEGDTIDLGEAAVEQLGLTLDPYPRMEGAVPPDGETDADDSPFSVLSRLPGPGKTRQ